MHTGGRWHAMEWRGEIDRFTAMTSGRWGCGIVENAQRCVADA